MSSLLAHPLIPAALPVDSHALVWLLLAVGFGGVLVALIILILSRWGEARPIFKCAVLSVIAHILLAGYAFMTQVFQPTPVAPGQKPSTVRFLSVEEETEERLTENTMEPWETVAELPELDLPEFPRSDAPTISDFPSSAIIATNSIDKELRTVQADALDILEQTTIPDSDEVVRKLDAKRVPDESSSSAALATAQDEITPITDSGTRAEQAPFFADTASSQVSDTSEGKRNSHPGEVGQPNRVAPQTGNNASPHSFVHTASSRAGSKAIRSQAANSKYKARTAENRQQQVQRFGGRVTQAAVDAALAWLASAQDLGDGRWDASRWQAGMLPGNPADQRVTTNAGGTNADTAITGLALLAFLGSGQTHLDGDFRKHVQRGLEFLLASQDQSSGRLSGNASEFAAMYCHGIATMALSEAYVMTRDTRIRPFLEKAVGYSISAQHPVTGGWRYRPGDKGDTSQFGWQLMSLMSARSAGLEIPESVLDGMQQWLEGVSSGHHGGLASYRPRERPSHTMTAEALVCRLFLDRPFDRATIEEAADFVSRRGVGSSKEPLNLYFMYYGTMGLFQVQGVRWTNWNQQVTGALVPRQRSAGPLAGSWDPDTVWGRNGGRVYSTALAAMCLESYYRYLPFYRPPEELRTARGRWLSR